MTEREQYAKCLSVFTEVVELVAQRYGERPDRDPGDERRVFYCQLGIALMLKAAHNNPKAAIKLFKRLLSNPAAIVNLKQLAEPLS